MAVAKKTTGGKSASGGKSRAKTTASRSVTTSQRSSGQRGKKKTAGSNGRKNTKTVQKRNNLEAMQEYQDHQAFEVGVTAFVLGIISIILYLSYFGLAGKVGTVVGGLVFGVFGWFAWFMPLFAMIGYIFSVVNHGDRRVTRRMSSFCGIVLSLMGLSDLLFGKQIITEYYTSNHVLHKEYFDCMYLTCKNVLERGKFNGGLLGRGVSVVFSSIIGKVGAVVLIFGLLLLFLYIFYGVEMMGHIRKRNAYQQEMQEIREKMQEEEEYREPSYRVFSSNTSEKKRRQKTMPELEKVPKVQSFDLQKLNERLDRMEKQGKISGAQREEIAFGIQESSVSETKEEEKRNEARKGVDSTIVEIKEEKKEPNEQKEAAQPEVSSVGDIPIYRNELDEKFGGKTKKKVERPKQIVREPIEFAGGSSAFATFSQGIQEENIESIKEEKDFSQEISEEQHEETAFSEELSEPLDETDKISGQEEDFSEEVVVPEPAKPMASFAHKEEVTDVTPSSQKRKEEKEGAVTGTDSDKANTVQSQKAVPSQMPEEKKTVVKEKPYEFPPIDLLSLPKGKNKEISDGELRLTAQKLQDTLKSFNVNVQIGAVTCGPTVTRYEILPEQGVRVNKITNLADDLKLSLAAPSIRIEAPIPGKAAVGIEVPNPEASAVPFRELLEGDTFAKAKSPLTFAVGKDIAGKIIMADIGKMPHVLIAGATGSGKSVCINTLIMSILYKADPKDVKLIMIDPKVVELSVYNGIPHLFCPVVTDPKEAAAALNWAVREMMERYNKFKELGVRNISGYNEKIKKVDNAAEAGYEKMPYLVVIVDEFADLMMVASKEVEDAVCRLAQLARAAGIHLVLATQRPSVNVITGVIKANIPSRVAFSVSSAIDSRTILDKGGAEKLLGKGDMLFFPSGYTEPVRVQGAFVSDKEVSDVVDFLCDRNETPEYNHAVTEIVEEPKEEEQESRKPASDRDEYFADAGRFVIESDRAAAGQLQRHFSIGFNRAGRIIDQLHKAGVVGPAEGTKPRKVLMTMEEFENMLLGGSAVSEEEMESMVQEMDDVAVTEEF